MANSDNETLEPEEAAKDIHVPIAALVEMESEVLQQVPNQLHVEMQQYRSRVTYETAIGDAQDMASHESPTMRTLQTLFASEEDRSLAANHGVLIGDLDTRSTSERIGIDMLGKSVGFDNLIQKTRALKNGEELQLDSNKGYILTAKAYQDGRPTWRIRLAEGLEQTDREAAMDAFSEAARTFNAPITATREELRNGLRADQPIAYGTGSFNWARDADTIMSFLDEAALPFNQGNSTPAMQRAKFIEQLYSLPTHYADDEVPAGQFRQRAGIYFDEYGRIQKVLIPAASPGVYFGLQSADSALTGDLTDIPLNLGMEVYVDETYVERDFNGNYYKDSKPFVETEAAAQLLGAFEAVGLAVSTELRGIVTETNLSTRYGHAYASLTREIAKLVNDPERDLDRLFYDADGDIPQKVRTLAEVQDPAAQVAIKLLQGVVDRSTDSQGLPVLKSSQHRVEIRDGSCKDIEVYLAQGNTIDGKPQLLRSGYKRPTVMTLEPTYLNGVRLPAGTLLAEEDDGYIMMRVTSYAFEAQVAAQAFGPQDAENSEHIGQARRQQIRSLMNPLDNS